MKFLARNLALAACGALFALAATGASANHYYGIDPAQNDPPIDVINGVLFGNGTVMGLLAGGAPQPNENFDHVVFYANAGDTITVNTIGSNNDPGLAILLDTANDGIFVGDAPPNTGTQLSFFAYDDDSAGGLNSLINFNAPYTGAYLASIAEIDGLEMQYNINVSGSTFVGGAPVPEPGTLALLVGASIGGVMLRRRKK